MDFGSFHIPTAIVVVAAAVGVWVIFKFILKKI